MAEGGMSDKANAGKGFGVKKEEIGLKSSDWLMEPRDWYSLRNFWEQHSAGKYYSGWPSLCSATASMIRSSANETARLVEIYEGSRRKCESRAEVVFVMNMHYGMSLLGPLLSSIVLAAFAVESFVKLTACALLRSKTSDLQQADKHLQQLSELNFPERLHETVQYAKLGELDADLEKQVNSLIFYRNQYAHDEPRLCGDVGRVYQFHRKTRRSRSVMKRRSFLELGDANRPLTLADTVWAAKVHDQLVEAFEVVRPILEKHSNVDRSSICGWVPITPDLIALSARWDGVDKWLCSIPIREIMTEGQAFMRRMQIRPVADEDISSSD